MRSGERRKPGYALAEPSPTGRGPVASVCRPRDRPSDRLARDTEDAAAPAPARVLGCVISWADALLFLLFQLQKVKLKCF